MHSDVAAVTGYAARSSSFHTQRFVALLGGDGQRAGRALGDSIEAANVVGLLSSEAALQLLAQGAAEVASERALVLFQRLAAAPGALAAQPSYSTQPYPGYCVALDILLRALPERRALVASWATLAPPIGPALGFALARLGELPGADLGSAALGTFAVAAATRFTACAEGFRDAV